VRILCCQTENQGKWFQYRSAAAPPIWILSILCKILERHFDQLSAREFGFQRINVDLVVTVVKRVPYRCKNFFTMQLNQSDIETSLALFWKSKKALGEVTIRFYYEMLKKNISTIKNRLVAVSSKSIALMTVHRLRSVFQKVICRQTENQVFGDVQ
jgi:hypothetical protein